MFYKIRCHEQGLLSTQCSQSHIIIVCEIFPSALVHSQTIVARDRWALEHGADEIPQVEYVASLGSNMGTRPGTST